MTNKKLSREVSDNGQRIYVHAVCPDNSYNFREKLNYVMSQAIEIATPDERYVLNAMTLIIAKKTAKKTMQSFGGKKNSYLELVMMPENNFKAKIVLDDESYIFEGKLEMDNSYSHLTSGIVEIKTKLLKRVFEFDTIEKRNYIVGNISIPLNEKKLSLN